MNPIIVNLVIAGIMALAQLVAGVVLLIFGNSTAQAAGSALVLGGVATGAAALMRTRGPDPVATPAPPPPLPPPPSPPPLPPPPP